MTQREPESAVIETSLKDYLISAALVLLVLWLISSPNIVYKTMGVSVLLIVGAQCFVTLYRTRKRLTNAKRRS